MNAPDVNLLIYAYDTTSEFHRGAFRFLQNALSSSAPFGIPVQCLYGFLRLITHPTIGSTRMPMPEAILIVDEWLALPQVKLLTPGPHHWHDLRSTIEQGRAMGSFVSDAAIAAVVIEHGATLQTNDRGFARFPNLRWENPLKAEVNRS
jgi:toxin-antitoxin system PIN domain toxin